MAAIKVSALAVAALIAATAGPAWSADPQGKVMESAVVTAETAKVAPADWGQLVTYFEGDSAGTRAALGAVAHIKADSEIHPPHSHEEEEYLLVTEGRGTWTLGDKSFPAKAGDMLYAAPYVLHGIRSAKDSPLSFVVVKFAPKAKGEAAGR